MSVLFQGFKGDEDVARLLIHEIRTEQFPFVGFLDIAGPWKFLAAAFPGHQGLSEAIDEWFAKQLIGPEMVGAALLGRTATVKAKLFELLNEGFRFWAVAALLEGWGMRWTPLSRPKTPIS